MLTVVGDIEDRTAGPSEAGLVCPSVESALAATKTGDRTPAPPRPELGLAPPVTVVDAGASDPSLGPGFRIVAEQLMYSAAWL